MFWIFYLRDGRFLIDKILMHTFFSQFGDMEKRNLVEKTLNCDIKKIFGSVKNLNDSKILNLYHKAKDSYEISFDTRKGFIAFYFSIFPKRLWYKGC